MSGSVGLIIDSSNGGSGDDFLNGFVLVGFKSAAWVFDWWLCWFDGLMAWVSDRRGFDGLCLCLCVWLRKKNTVEAEVEGEGCG